MLPRYDYKCLEFDGTAQLGHFVLSILLGKKGKQESETKEELWT